MAGAGLLMATTLNMVELEILNTGDRGHVEGRIVIEHREDVKRKITGRSTTKLQHRLRHWQDSNLRLPRLVPPLRVRGATLD